MKHNVLNFIEAHSMVSPGDRVICGLSGGKDSMAMLHVLLELKDRLGISLSAAHVNHGLRDEESQRDEDFVRRHCDYLGIPLHVAHVDVSGFANRQHIGLEEAARILRYDYLEGIDPSAKIATAHTADDNLETLLMHLVRGTGLRGLGGIPPVRGRIIRPLLCCDTGMILDYISRSGLSFIEDSTNHSDFCLRNRIRHHVMPILAEENPSVSVLSSQLALQLRQDELFLAETASAMLEDISRNGGISCEGLRKLPENMAIRVLELYLKDVPQLRRTHLMAALSLCKNDDPSARLSLPGNVILRREYDLATTLPLSPEAPPSPAVIAPGEDLIFGSWLIRCSESLQEVGAPALCLKYPSQGYFTVRTRMPGDRIQLSGGSKKISRYMADQKIPIHIRKTTPVLLSGNQIAAVLPYQADMNFIPKDEACCYITAKNLEEVKNDA